jgi:hypothetical protein
MYNSKSWLALHALFIQPLKGDNNPIGGEQARCRTKARPCLLSLRCAMVCL